MTTLSIPAIKDRGTTNVSQTHQQRPSSRFQRRETLSKNKCMFFCLCLNFLFFIEGLCFGRWMCWSSMGSVCGSIQAISCTSLIFTHELLWECPWQGSSVLLSPRFVFPWHAVICVCCVWFVTPQPQSSLDNERAQHLLWEGEGQEKCLEYIRMSHDRSMTDRSAVLSRLTSQQKQWLYVFSRWKQLHFLFTFFN